MAYADYILLKNKYNIKSVNNYKMIINGMVDECINWDNYPCIYDKKQLSHYKLETYIVIRQSFFYKLPHAVYKYLLSFISISVPNYTEECLYYTQNNNNKVKRDWGLFEYMIPGYVSILYHIYDTIYPHLTNNQKSHLQLQKKGCSTVYENDIIYYTNNDYLFFSIFNYFKTHDLKDKINAHDTCLIFIKNHLEKYKKNLQDEIAHTKNEDTSVKKTYLAALTNFKPDYNFNRIRELQSKYIHLIKEIKHLQNTYNEHKNTVRWCNDTDDYCYECGANDCDYKPKKIPIDKIIKSLDQLYPKIQAIEREYKQKMNSLTENKSIAVKLLKLFNNQRRKAISKYRIRYVHFPYICKRTKLPGTQLCDETCIKCNYYDELDTDEDDYPEQFEDRKEPFFSKDNLVNYPSASEKLFYFYNFTKTHEVKPSYIDI